MGFTDTIISPWLQLSPLCSFDGRLTFRFSISNDRDHIEIYLIENNRTQTTSLGQWKSTTNKAHSIKVDDLSLQQGNITFQVSEQFQVRNCIQNTDKIIQKIHSLDCYRSPTCYQRSKSFQCVVCS